MQLPSNNLNSKLPIFKVLIIVGIIAVVAELSWAGYTYFYSDNQLPTTGSAPNKEAASSKSISSTASLSLKPDQVSTKVGQQFSVDINVISSLPSYGVDVVIKYDPAALDVVPVNAIKAPVAVKDLFTDYPVNKIDTAQAQILLSGITSKSGGITLNGTMGTIKFAAKNAGQTKIDVVFNKGKTTASNVVESKTAKNILETVQGVTVNIAK